MFETVTSMVHIFACRPEAAIIIDLNNMADLSDQLISDVSIARKEFFSNVENANELFYLNDERGKVRKAFDMAFQYRLSTSLIMIGSSSNEALNLVKSTLVSYCNEVFQTTGLGNRFDRNKNYTAKINGSLHSSDQEALSDLANQFLVRNDREGAVSLALDDLEYHFRQCRLDGVPAIIVIEDFHVFTKRKRQTLIYALLDLMHKKDLLFTIVGITDHSDVETKLEKRVVSRLNAQYVFMSKATGADVCGYMRDVFTLENRRSEKATAVSGASGGNSGGGGNAMNRTGEELVDSSSISAEYATKFAAGVEALFGRYEDAGAGVEPGSSSGGVSTDEPGGPHVAAGHGRRLFVPGSLHGLFCMHTDWGRDLSYFTRVAIKAICGLSASQPYLSEATIHSALASLEPENIDETLSGLSSLELHLFISVLHVYGRSQQGGAGSGSASGGGGGGAGGLVAFSSCSRPQVMLVEKVLSVCDMLVEVFKQKLVPKSRVVQALCSLAQKGLIFMMNAAPGRHTMPVGALSLGVQGAEQAGSSSFGSVTGQTLLMLNVSYEQAVDAFRVKRPHVSIGGGESGGGYRGRPRVTIQVNERLRKAVLEPVVPVVYQASTSLGGGAALVI